MHLEHSRDHATFNQRLINGRATEAERKLMLAVLQNAIEDLRKYVSATDRKGALLFQQAQEWIQEKDSRWFLSFDRICHTLSLSPDRLRQDLLGPQQSNSRKMNTRPTHIPDHKIAANTAFHFHHFNKK